MSKVGAIFIGVALLTLTSCDDSVNNMLEQNKQMVLHLHREIWSNGNLDLCDEVYAQDFVCHFLVGPEWHGPEGVKDHIKALRAAFPDWREEVEDIIAEGDRVVTRFTSYGTHRGSFQGIPATGQAVVVREVAIFRLRNGKIVEQWGFPDIAGLRDQLLEPTEPGQIVKKEPKTNTDSRAIQATGHFSPDGPPVSPPKRIDAGQCCIVDLNQEYTVTGSLSGIFNIDYRIKVDGPCGSPLGTYNEDWIAHGTFSGTIDESKITSSFTYVAHVSAGGNVDGKMVFGQGLSGELKVRGNFADGKLLYNGFLAH